MHIKKGDNIIVLSGKDKGKKGSVVEAFPRIGKVRIEGVNVVKRHDRARKQGQKGQIINVSMPIDASNVRLDGKKVKVAKVVKPKAVKAPKKAK